MFSYSQKVCCSLLIAIMSTPAAKRALDMGSMPAPKRLRRSTRPVALYRLTKPEMKTGALAIAHSATTGSNLDLTNIAQGTGNSERLAGKVKFWNFDIVGQANYPIRIDFVIPRITNSLPSYSATSQIDYSEGQVLATYMFNPANHASYDLFHYNLKLPYGIVSTWDGAAGSTIQTHQIICRITSFYNATVNGAVRLSFTDP